MVRVDAFSKIRAISLPLSRGCSKPPYLAALRSIESLIRNLSSSGVKSNSLTKLRFRKLLAMLKTPSRRLYFRMLFSGPDSQPQLLSHRFLADDDANRQHNHDEDSKHHHQGHDK